TAPATALSIGSGTRTQPVVTIRASPDHRDDRIELREPPCDDPRAELPEQRAALGSVMPRRLPLDLLRLAPGRRLEDVPAGAPRWPERGEVALHQIEQLAHAPPRATRVGLAAADRELRRERRLQVDGQERADARASESHADASDGVRVGR